MENANEIIPGIWLGNKAASEDVGWQKSHNIGAVFNCTKTLPFHNKSVNLYRVPVDDNLQKEEIDNMKKWSAEAVYKVIKEREKGHSILIHCHAGMQRSAALVAMLLIATQKMDSEEAVAFIRKKRSIAFFPYINFKNAIQGFEKEIRTKLA